MSSGKLRNMSSRSITSSSSSGVHSTSAAIRLSSTDTSAASCDTTKRDSDSENVHDQRRVGAAAIARIKCFVLKGRQMLDTQQAAASGCVCVCIF
eukprot:3799987-Pleurochrysis_carterae.AAC.2